MKNVIAAHFGIDIDVGDLLLWSLLDDVGKIGFVDYGYYCWLSVIILSGLERV